MISFPTVELHENQFSIKFKLRWKNWNEPLEFLWNARHLSVEGLPGLGWIIAGLKESAVYHHSILMKNSFCCHPSCSKAITSKFCTCHDSCAVVTCAKCCNDIIPHSGVTWKPIFHQIQITMEKLKWSPWIPAECQTLISWRVAWIRLDYSRIKGIRGVS